MVDKELVKKQALLEILKDGKGVAGRLAVHFGQSRQAMHKHLKTLVQAGQIVAEGSTRSLIYKFKTLKLAHETYKRQGLSEDRVWSEVCAPFLKDLPENVRSIWQYGITEIVNNAVDHSESENLSIRLEQNALFTKATVSDQGIGIFVKIQKALDLYDPRDAILELAKGKFTTDPQRHSGEGIFFSSKVFDEFDILSSHLFYTHVAGNHFDVLIDHGKISVGTRVHMKMDNESSKLLKAVFDEFATPEAFTFSKTLVPVRLAQYEGETLVSRSQAKRLTLRFEKFRHVLLDFEGVNEIGQAFADELFRVFVLQHPSVELMSTNMTTAVAQMEQRARAAKLETEGS